MATLRKIPLGLAVQKTSVEGARFLMSSKFEDIAVIPWESRTMVVRPKITIDGPEHIADRTYDKVMLSTTKRTYKFVVCYGKWVSVNSVSEGLIDTYRKMGVEVIK